MALLSASAFLSIVAVLCFLQRPSVAKFALQAAMLAAAAGAFMAGLGAVALILTGASCGCSLHAARMLAAHSERWVHRFVIYAGYGGTFALMAAASLWLAGPFDSNLAVAGALAGIWVAGSCGIFAAKTLTLRRAARLVPDYDQRYW